MNNVMVKGGEITKLENELVSVREEVEKAKRTRDDLQALIDRKTSDYEIYISSRDTETKKMQADLQLQRDKLNSDRTEFQQILLAHKQDKEFLEQAKREFDIGVLKFAATKQNVQEFITAVRRATGLLGF